MTEYCRDRKTIAFLPLIATSRKFKEILNRKGFHAEEISGTDFPEARQRKLRDFEEGKTNVLCNSMLLTEGFDCPSIDCVICLRPTKIRALYTQIVGRGTRLAPCKEYVLLLDFLWHSERMELCHPAHLISDDAKVQKRMTEILEDKADDPMLIEGLDIQELEVEAESDVVRQREAALAEHLRELKTRKSKFVDPLQWEMSISSNDLASYEETFAWELKPMTDKQKASLEKWGINPDEVETCGKARLILDKLQKRREAGLTTPKQIRMLERKGFQRVGEWQFSEASKLIDEIAQNGWRVPYSFGRPADYVPLSMRSKAARQRRRVDGRQECIQQSIGRLE
ncbi:helicase-related protein [Allobaculum sp. Allo2]|nr:helicase-related protein [Allobaculum sp. Allo2]